MEILSLRSGSVERQINSRNAGTEICSSLLLPCQLSDETSLEMYASVLLARSRCDGCLSNSRMLDTRFGTELGTLGYVLWEIRLVNSVWSSGCRRGGGSGR